MRKRYERLVFDRGERGRDAAMRVLGVGHALVDAAVREGQNLAAAAAFIDDLDVPILIVGIEDRITDTGAAVRRIVLGVRATDYGFEVIRDWELLRTLGSVTGRQHTVEEIITSVPPDWIGNAVGTVKHRIDELAGGMRHPIARPLVALVPSAENRVA